MMHKSMAALPIGLALFAGAGFAGPVTLTTSVMKESVTRDAEGRVQTQLIPAPKAAPGDALVYVLTYRNGGARAATNVVVTNPIPADMEYAGPADGPAPLVSIDSKTFATLDALKSRHGEAEAPGAYADVKAVRWTLAEAVPAGGEAKMSFRAKLK